jgi:hypothetical protein
LQIAGFFVTSLFMENLETYINTLSIS